MGFAGPVDEATGLDILVVDDRAVIADDVFEVFEAGAEDEVAVELDFVVDVPEVEDEATPAL